jgi:serine protease Do
MLTFLLLATLAQAPALPGRAPPDDVPDDVPGEESPAVVPPLPVATLPPATHELFERIKRRVAQVRIIERRSGTKSSIGSAFFVDAKGHAVTNYHVISSIVHQPEDYTVELVREGQDAQAVPVRVVDVDVVHDLAVIQQDVPVKDWFELAATEPPQGTRLYAMGNPHDLGTTIVEGTYNGLVQDALYDKVHFSGAINPGMSGGPTVTSEGRVVGVNVATLGNQLGFLVPVVHARALVERARGQTGGDPAELLAVVGAQLLDNQQRITERLLAEPLMAQGLGEYRVPGRWLPFLKCWGDTPHEPENPYTVTRYQCSSEEDIFLSGEHRTGVVAYDHAFVSSDELGPLRFAALYSATFGDDAGGVDATKADVTNFRCKTEFVQVGGLPVRVALCLRAYKKLPGLYDLALRAATNNASTSGVQTSLDLAGFSADNARALARRYLEALAWTK